MDIAPAEEALIRRKQLVTVSGTLVVGDRPRCQQHPRRGCAAPGKSIRGHRPQMHFSAGCSKKNCPGLLPALESPRSVISAETEKNYGDRNVWTQWPSGQTLPHPGMPPVPRPRCIEVETDEQKVEGRRKASGAFLLPTQLHKTPPHPCRPCRRSACCKSSSARLAFGCMTCLLPSHRAASRPSGRWRARQRERCLASWARLRAWGAPSA